MSILLTKLETFLDNIGIVSDEEFIKSLQKFLEQEKKPKITQELKEIIKQCKQDNDDMIYKKIRTFTENYQTFDPKTFLTSDPLPDFDAFKKLTHEQLQSCVAFDKGFGWFEKNQIVYKLNNLNVDAEFIIWLIDNGFVATEWDLFAICERGQFKLFKFYFERKVIDALHNCHILPIIIKKNNMQFLKYILDNNLIYNGTEQTQIYTIKNIFDMYVQACIEHNNIPMLGLLFSKDKENVIEAANYCFNVLTYPMKKATRDMCLWFWSNNIKWNLDQAKKANNNFMISFF